jgi:hypothetical protein
MISAVATFAIRRMFQRSGHRFDSGLADKNMRQMMKR